VIADTDRLCLAPGVEVSDGKIVDGVRGASWPLNRSGALVLSCVDLPLGGVAQAVKDAFAVPLETARRDVFRFALSLNALALANIERRGSRLRHAADWMRVAARLVPAGAVPGVLARRREVDTTTISRAVLSAFAATMSRVAVVSFATAVVAAQIAVVGGDPGVAGPVALGLGTGLALGLHEAAHVAMLRGVPSALVVRGRRTFVLHAPVGRGRRSLVAVAGPLAPVVIGVAIVSTGIGLGRLLVVVAGLPLVTHASALTVVGGDGRIACGL
jgi:hypothetical protein